MLKSTFLFLQGIGEVTERRLWEHGITDWTRFLSTSGLPGVAPARKRQYDEQVQTALEQFHQGRVDYFADALKPRDHWRVFGAFRARTGYLDIETTGEPAGVGQVTVVGLYVQGTMFSLVNGMNLSEGLLSQALSRCDVLVTFFGSGFDLPYLKATFPGLKLDQAHFDLCFAARRLGLRGGLKHIEGLCGIARSSDVQGLDGWDAVRLWQAWRLGDRDSLNQLVRYNEADVMNLEPLADHLYSRLVARYWPPRLAGDNLTPGDHG